jgi:hypothetical protein
MLIIKMKLNVPSAGKIKETMDDRRKGSQTFDSLLDSQVDRIYCVWWGELMNWTLGWGQDWHSRFSYNPFHVLNKVIFPLCNKASSSGMKELCSLLP